MAVTDRQLLEDKDLRVAYCEHDFFWWFQYHFGFKCKKFHKEWIKSLQSRKNTMITAFRASRKTSIVRAFVVWCIVYRKEPSIIVQSFEDSLSAEWVREVAKMLFKRTIVADHGMLFPISSTKEDLAKKSLSNFETTNGVKVASKSLGQTVRGSNTYDVENEMAARPTLLILDDIDVTKSVSNPEIINQNEKKIRGETIGSLDPLRRKIIFLGNVIFEDGIVPRFHNQYKNAESWDCFWQPLYDAKGENQWPEVFTDEVVKVLLDDGKISFNQNYKLIADVMGNGVFVRDYFDYFLLSHFEDVDSPLKKSDLNCGLFVDPAFSTNADSDDACVIGGAQHMISKSFYIIDGYADTSAPSKTINAIITMYNKMVANGFPPRFISVESVKISKKQTQFIKDLKDKLIEHQISVPVYLYVSHVEKNNRIKANLEPIMSQQGIKTNRNIADPLFVAKMERQFLEFPNGEHDDIPDTVSQMVEVFRTRGQEKKPTSKVEKVVADPVLRSIGSKRGSGANSFSSNNGSTNGSVDDRV